MFVGERTSDQLRSTRLFHVSSPSSSLTLAHASTTKAVAKLKKRNVRTMGTVYMSSAPCMTSSSDMSFVRSGRKSSRRLMNRPARAQDKCHGYTHLSLIHTGVTDTVTSTVSLYQIRFRFIVLSFGARCCVEVVHSASMLTI